MPEQADSDWHLQEWAAELGKKQADLVTELGWHKNTAHLVWHSRQPYRRDLVNMVADWLKIRPHELLMTPAEAIALRRLRAMAAVIVAEDGRPFDHEGADRTPPKGRGSRR